MLSCFTLSADRIWDERAEGGLLTRGNKEFSTTIWDSARSGRDSCGSVYVCVLERVCRPVPASLFYFSFPPVLPSLCLSPHNKAEYLFLPSQLSSLLKGAGDWADIRPYVCATVKCVCMCGRCRSFTPRVCLSHHPSQAYSCVSMRANTLRLKVADSEPWGLVEERPLAGPDWAVLRWGRKVTVACHYLPAPVEFISIADIFWQNLAQPSK